MNTLQNLLSAAGLAGAKAEDAAWAAVDAYASDAAAAWSAAAEAADKAAAAWAAVDAARNQK